MGKRRSQNGNHVDRIPWNPLSISLDLPPLSPHSPLISGVVAREKAPLILVRVHFLANLYFVSHPTPREIKGDGEVREPARG